jgi:hypothetical protein
MSIEQNIAALTAAVIELTNAIRASGTTTVPQAAVAVTTAAPPVAAHFAPSVAPAMPAPPTFAPPAFAAPAPAAPVAPSAPFSDGQGLIAYVMAAYKEMGPAKGANIQGVLTSLGYQNINDVKPEHYGNLYQGVEALKKA